MKHLLLTVLGLLLLQTAWAQIDTTGGRYRRPLFAQVTVTRGVAFGSATNIAGTTQNLLLDLYEPTGDTVRRRPLVIMAHEGAFATGNRDDQFMTAICTRLAQLGYVTASIDYRLGFFPFDSANIGRASIRASQDMRAAVRFFRRDAATARQYRIHPSYVFAGGSSAGAFMALQLGYLDKPAEVPAYVDLAQLGTLEGTSGNPGYSSQIAAVINLCGAVGSLAWLEPGNVPLCSVHGTADATVPYNIGRAFGQSFSPRIYGSGVLKPRADAVGISNVLRTLRGAPHVPYNGTSAAATAYADTTFQTVRDFLRPLLRQPGTVLRAASRRLSEAPQVFPVPADGDVFYLQAGTAAPFRPRAAELLDATGRVVRRFTWDQPRMAVPRGALRPGTYLLRTDGLPAQRVLFQ
ncbi:alpha/beta hydrolase [Hymenobacter sp. 15J16-1T3B]|uniref:alpha/beta hydrolase n=1 Tax=Hymenobacter sp. 15J16-1T3B TaxID=2886941 RepID=UPI001D1000DE|nr:alpha/beta hydrolase [Hymenobacter sp. 15J16-1T3B]MCC3159979.1 alpha/beta hydrolase [Hymenobacter sp. 15J16-1T3B]